MNSLSTFGLCNISLPKWLDELIYHELDASYSCQGRNFVSLNWGVNEIRAYLGTYFPRSFAEAYGVFRFYFRRYRLQYYGLETFSVFDFGCGTGGQLVALLLAVAKELPDVREVRITALDGNRHALRMMEQVVSETAQQTGLSMKICLIPMEVEDFYDLSIVSQTLSSSFDLVMSFKAICEFVTNQQFGEKNPYEHFLRTFLPKLKPNGVVCIAEISTFNEVAKEWLPTMLDKAAEMTEVSIIARNTGYYDKFCVAHSHAMSDCSKLAWRIYKYHSNNV